MAQRDDNAENDPLLGYESEDQAKEGMRSEDAVLTELVHSGHEGFGGKTIGSQAGAILLLNNMMGVGLPLLPMLFQQAGVIPPLVTIVFVALLSGYAATMLTEAMKYLPGNRNFDDRVVRLLAPVHSCCWSDTYTHTHTHTHTRTTFVALYALLHPSSLSLFCFFSSFAVSGIRFAGQVLSGQVSVLRHTGVFEPGAAVVQPGVDSGDGAGDGLDADRHLQVHLRADHHA
jgi:hypothetical protein